MYLKKKKKLNTGELNWEGTKIWAFVYVIQEISNFILSIQAWYFVLI